jgi:CheY-like chemotaxis protein
MKRAGMLNPVQVAMDGRQAIHYLDGADEFSDRKKFPLPSMVLLDLKLPHVMGLDVLKWIREQPELRTVIVLIFTSSKLPPDINKAYFLGANSYLVKPSEPEGLLRTVGLIKEYWLDVNQTPPALEAQEHPAQAEKVTTESVSAWIRPNRNHEQANTSR